VEHEVIHYEHFEAVNKVRRPTVLGNNVALREYPVSNVAGDRCLREVTQMFIGYTKEQRRVNLSPYADNRITEACFKMWLWLHTGCQFT
jgi:hypothetical protein